MPSERVATCHMTAIFRSPDNPYTFRDDMEELSEEAAQLAMCLFKRDATFRSNIWGPGAPEPGTGVWSSELESGVLVLLDELKVHHSFRGMGLGTKMFDRVLEWIKSADLGARAYIIVVPGALFEDMRREFPELAYHSAGNRAEYQAYDAALKVKAVAFYRKLGFRRIGLSQYFGYAMDPKHPSKFLTAEEDSEMDDK